VLEERTLSHKRLAALIQEQQEALVADPATSLTHDTILGSLNVELLCFLETQE